MYQHGSMYISWVRVFKSHLLFTSFITTSLENDSRLRTNAIINLKIPNIWHGFDARSPSYISPCNFLSQSVIFPVNRVGPAFQFSSFLKTSRYPFFICFHFKCYTMICLMTVKAFPKCIFCFSFCFVCKLFKSSLLYYYIHKCRKR